MMPATRRRVLGWLGAAALPVAARAEDAPEAFPRDLTIVVAGPPGGRLDTAAQALLGGLQGALPAGTTLDRHAVGGVDGVTGANQFATLNVPDGAAALLVPGAAALAWLVGDSRVHFDPAQWLPVLAGIGPAIMVARRATPHATAPVRVAGGVDNGPTLAGLLALDLLGLQVTPVPHLEEDRTALAALRSGSIDALLLRNPALLAALPPDLAPLFSCGVPDAAGALHRDALNPGVPTLAEYAATLGRPVAAGPLYDAWRCAAGAAQLHYALVLPSLTQASAVALWRDAGSRAFTTNLAAEPGMIYASDAAGLMQALTPNAAALLDLRRWLAARLGWQAG